jgi:hypothetical protein
MKNKVIECPSPYLISLVNSPDHIFEVFNKSNVFLKNNPEYKELIELHLEANRDILDLIPQFDYNFGSGHIFPLLEAEYELESSINLALFGFYKQAIYSLRNYLELGLLSVYWNIEDTGHITIQNWLRSLENTPFKNYVFKQILKNKNIEKFNNEMNIIKEIDTLYKELCNYIHTKGVKYSSWTLGMSNVNNFDGKTFIKYLNYFKQAVRIIVALHLLKYPVGLQYTPILEKFGLNEPIGGFLRPYQVEQIKKIFEDKTLEVLQKISNEDESAVALAEEINRLPDIGNEEFTAQIEEDDKWKIEVMGFKNWFRNQKMLLKSLKTENQNEYKRMLAYIKKMKKWAKSKNLITK